ncbi:MAG: AraC family transcriptional regulator [Bradyrhizobium sp.]|uniref:AraC family transcriptional regulator n=1 Tax=Bradyrhizobium sp. TaxID=376 RepID=UPI003D0EB3CA
MDPLTDVLRAVRLSGGVFLSAHFTAPWGIAVSIGPDDCAPLLGRPAQVIAYHVVVEGEMFFGMSDQSPVEARAGEIVLFPRNTPHTLSSAPGLPAVTARELMQPGPDGQLPRIEHGGGGASTRIFCGFLASEDSHSPLILSLPQALKIDIRKGTEREWIETSVRYAAHQLAEGTLASSSVMTRLSETLLIEAIRQFAATPGTGQHGWLNGLSDPRIGRSLALMHRDVGANWSAEVLAKEVGMSRSAFVERFTALVGMPPIRYLSVYRLQMAKLNLRETRKSIAQLARHVGYQSEQAFNRAFKREFGMTPGAWRDA